MLTQWHIPQTIKGQKFICIYLKVRSYHMCMEQSYEVSYVMLFVLLMVCNGYFIAFLLHPADVGNAYCCWDMSDISLQFAEVI